MNKPIYFRPGRANITRSSDRPIHDILYTDQKSRLDRSWVFRHPTVTEIAQQQAKQAKIVSSCLRTSEHVCNGDHNHNDINQKSVLVNVGTR